MVRPELSALSPSAQNLLKVIWGLGEWTDEPVTTSDIARRTGLRASTVSDAVRRLTDQDLLHHERYGVVALTPAGRALAVAMVRRHRLVETFLVRTLGYGWDEVHDEAEELEHAVSDLFVERVDAALGHPAADPHGDPIPAADGTTTRPDAARLDECPAGPAVVVRVADVDPALLRACAAAGVVPGARIEVTDPGEAAVAVGQGGEIRGAAGALWVRAEPAASTPGAASGGPVRAAP